MVGISTGHMSPQCITAYTVCILPVGIPILYLDQSMTQVITVHVLLSGVPDYFDRNKISSGGDLSHYSSASLY